MDIDVSKENIQPLRGGRNLAQLGTALQAQSDVDAQRQLHLQKEEHEAAIRHYQGPDPLDPWFNYIQWVEQSFPKHGHEGHLDKLIKDCLQLFEKDIRYYQDRRFVKLWIKYVDCLSNPLEIYQMLYNTGIGVECSEFYRAWACYCEESGDYKKANQVYMMGLQANAQPLDELEQAHMNFQLFFAQRMLHDDSPTKRKAASALAETRMALTSLKSFKRRNIASAPVQRVGENVRSIVPGVMRQQGQFDNRIANTNVMVNVYEDAPSTSTNAIPLAENPGPASLVQSVSNVENLKEVGIWTNAKTKMVHSNVVPHQPLPFTPYEDTDEALKLPPNHVPYCLDDVTFNVPLCVPDPPDSTKIPCYNKSQVYGNDKEYSLEEIRARKYNIQPKMHEEQPDKLEVQTNPSRINETLSQCSALETLANCALDAEQDHLGQLMPLAMPAIQNITKVTNMHSPGEPKVLVNLDSKEVSELSGKKYDADKENQADRPTIQTIENYDNVASNFGKQNLMEEFNRSLMGNFLSDSVTVNTKEARWELRNLFNDNEPTMVQPVVQQFELPKFDIHEDQSITMAINTKKKQEFVDARVSPDKENAKKFAAPDAPTAMPSQSVNKTTYYEEPSCTQVFNFNIKDASTPNMSQFKKPTTCIDQGNKMPSVPKFSIDESVIETLDQGTTKRDEDLKQYVVDQHATDNQGTVLSVIMEATREFHSKSGSSSSGQSMRTNYTGYTTTPYSEKTQGSNFDSIYNQQNDPAQPSTSKRNSINTQPRLPNGQFARNYPQKREQQESKPAPVPYLSHDHQYQKPVPPNYNGYTSQTPVHSHYQQNYGYQQNYLNNPAVNTQQNYGSPSPNAYQSPQHPGMQSPHPMSPSVPPGFQSPTYSNQVGYHNTGQAMMSPQSVHGRQEYHYSSQEVPHTYVNQSQPPQTNFASPSTQAPYQSPQYYQRPNQVPVVVNQLYGSQNYSGGHNQYSNTNAYANNSNQNFNTNQSYSQSPKPMVENSSLAYGVANGQMFQIYQSPTQNNHRSPAVHGANMSSESSRDLKVAQLNTKPAKPKTPTLEQNAVNKSIVQPKNPTPQRSPTSSLRNIRHEQPNVKLNQNSPDVGFCNQFLNFISNRNEPKDNANTPKFTNSPSISQKMHKNLYVSSPEQAQIPPSSGLSDSDSKDGMTAQTITPIQSAKETHVIDKQKEISKRQLDFEHRIEIQSEDSRDSMSKESRISSVYSRQSDFQSDGYGMDVDSENSMECGAFKSTHSISLIETSDIPRPADIELPAVIDPFNKKLLTKLLDYVKFPNKTHAEGYNEVRSIPKLQVATLVGVGNNKFSIEKQLGKGNYGAVFLCLDVHINKSVAVKYQKPSRPWEFYICQEIKARIKDPFMLPGYMDITTAFLGDNASLFVSEYSKYGSLLDVANKIRVATSKCINEFIVMLLTSEMLSIVHYLHKAQIIHADIKPDNFLLMKIPTEEWRTPSLQLIDMGCSIDMSLFPEGTTFRELIATEGFTCTEMREGKPWTYQTDLYCLAGTIYVILMGNYMKVANRLGQWNIDKKLPRYMKVSLWDKIFTTLLNVPDCNNLPDLMDLKNEVDNLLNGVDTLGSQLRTFANVLKSR